ncbi:hypothetical protein CRG98_045298 [Punica granatum]|nr:hypothetical protein CRG98_045298 [Punica granatum]
MRETKRGRASDELRENRVVRGAVSRDERWCREQWEIAMRGAERERLCVRESAEGSWCSGRVGSAQRKVADVRGREEGTSFLADSGREEDGDGGVDG